MIPPGVDETLEAACDTGNRFGGRHRMLLVGERVDGCVPCHARDSATDVVKIRFIVLTTRPKRTFALVGTQTEPDSHLRVSACPALGTAPGSIRWHALRADDTGLTWQATCKHGSGRHRLRFIASHACSG
jgi:hypothetical protein